MTNKKASTKRETDEQRKSSRVAEQALKTKEAASKKLHAELQLSIAPHEQGTVTQLAEKFGVSKSEIRRHKRLGTLDQLINPQVGEAL